MFTLGTDTTSHGTLQQPTPDWGVKVEKLVFTDFLAPLITTLVAMGAVWVYNNPFAESINILGETFTVQGTATTVAFIFFTATFVLICLRLSQPANQANAKARELGRTWQREHLIPYLEQKYGITIISKNLFGLHFSWAEKDGRMFSFHTPGIYCTIQSFGGEGNYQNYVLTNKNGPIIEEVILPKAQQVTYVPMEPVS